MAHEPTFDQFEQCRQARRLWGPPDPQEQAL